MTNYTTPIHTTIVDYDFREFDNTSTANTIYIGGLKKDKSWQIMRFDSSLKTMRYANGLSDYDTAWTGRVGLTYV